MITCQLNKKNILSLCKTNTNVDIVQLVYNLYPEGIISVDDPGALPLHSAAWSNTNVDVVQLVYNLYPNAIRNFRDIWRLVSQNHNKEVQKFILSLK